MNQKNTNGFGAVMLMISIATTFSGWLVLSVVHPVPTTPGNTVSRVTPLPLMMRDPDAAASQPIVMTRVS